jgi:anthranilate phosphoribosyltransferase
VIETALEQLAAGSNLTHDEMSQVMDSVMQGECTDQQITTLLTSLHEKGESVEEIAGAAASLRRHMQRIRSRHSDLIDTCGTGGDRCGTFNISTAAAIVTAACGVPVAKHGNRRITSRSGSVDVLAQLGVNVEADLETVEHCLDDVGICFCFAPLMHPSMKHVAAVRRQLGTPTIFNMLGPLCNPASTPYQLIGVGRPQLRPKLAAALAQLGTKRAAVVCGDDGLDEVSLSGPTQVTVVEGNATRQLVWSPAEFGLPEAPVSALKVDSPAESAGLIQQVLEGQPGPPRDVVVLNAAAAIWVGGKAASLPAAATLAQRAIDQGLAQQRLQQLVAASHNQPIG